jgi:hypothetical protein
MGITVLMSSVVLAFLYVLNAPLGSLHEGMGADILKLDEYMIFCILQCRAVCTVVL